MSSFPTSQLRLGVWNIDSLHTRIVNDRTSKLCFDQVKHPISQLDIFGLVETHCNSTDVIELENYHIEQNLRPKSLNAPRAFGGLAVGVKLHLLKGVTFLKKTHTEFMWVRLCKQFFGIDNDIFVCVVYISPNSSSFSHERDDIFSLIEKDVATYSKQGYCLVLGDFNARTNIEYDFVSNDSSKFLDSLCTDYIIDTHISRNNLDKKLVDKHGQLLLDLCRSSGLRIVNGRKLGDLQGNYTCYSHTGNPSVIDYILCSHQFLDSVNYLQVHELTPFSIHCMVSCTFRTNICSREDLYTDNNLLRQTPNQYKWNLHSDESWTRALKHPDIVNKIDSYLTEINHVQDIPTSTSTDLMVENFNTLINDVCKVAGIGKTHSRSSKRNGNSNKRRKCKKWYDDDCKVLSNEMKTLARCIKYNPSNLVLVHRYHSLKKKYKKLLNKKKQSFRNDLFKMMDNLHDRDPKTFWNIYNDLCDNNNKVSSKNPIAPREWLNHFIGLMNRNIQHSDEQFSAMIDDFWTNVNLNAHDLDLDFSCKEIIDAARQLKKNKSPGIDGIRSEMLKSGIHSLTPILCKLFNHIYKSGSFPNEWRLSVLSVIHKKGDKKLPKNYRGIAVGSNLNKLFCLVLHNRLEKFVTDNRVIPDEQIGFRKKSRTSDHVLVLKTLIDRYVNNKSYLYVCFIDFSSAFDTIWRNALLYKLFHNGVNGRMIKIIHDMYRTVSFTIKCNGGITDSFHSTVGVKQGCILSPLFFNVFLSDLPNIFDNSCDPVYLGGSSLNCLLYADDLIILSESASGLQCALNKLHTYCKKWKLSVNIGKTNVMIFNKGGKLISRYTFHFGNSPVTIATEYCYLGIVFVPSGSFTKAMNKLKDKASKAFFKIRNDLYDSNYKGSSKLFNTLVVPIISYGCEVWSPYLLKNLNDSNFIKICDSQPGESLHIKTCKLILGVHRKSVNHAVRGELGSYPLLLLMLSLAVKYWWKLNDSCFQGNNSIVVRALTDNRKYADTCNTWSKGIKQILTLINRSDIWDKPNIVTTSSISDVISSALKTIYENLWLDVVKLPEGKLRTYATFKNIFQLENYVTMFNKPLRSTFTTLRISAHTLMIEKGRYFSPKLPVENRICKLCNLGKVEDEYHFIMECTLYTEYRDRCFDSLLDFVPLDVSDYANIFTYIMCAIDYDVLNIITKYVKDAFDKRARNTVTS